MMKIFNFVHLCPKRWFQFNSRIARTHFSSIMTLNDCRNAKLLFQVTFSFPSTSCLFKLPIRGTYEDKIEDLSSYAHVVHTTAKQVISRRRENENVFKMSKDEKCTCKACKNTVFHCQICKYVEFLLPSSSWLLKTTATATTTPSINALIG